ncbi:hypothetical protein ['Camptotheca acuminata' phytoplasma]|uniref:hypothetical protein n=1 Tax='Camptotheca acuminata' phytoplasma TaxID=3239192 RepID=UPI00351A4D23
MLEIINFVSFIVGFLTLITVFIVVVFLSFIFSNSTTFSLVVKETVNSSLKPSIMNVAPVGVFMFGLM